MAKHIELWSEFDQILCHCFLNQYKDICIFESLIFHFIRIYRARKWGE